VGFVISDNINILFLRFYKMLMKPNEMYLNAGLYTTCPENGGFKSLLDIIYYSSADCILLYSYIFLVLRDHGWYVVYIWKKRVPLMR